MKARWRSDQGVTLLEILFVVLILGMLMALLMPAIARSKLKAKRAQCIGNLKQQGVVFHSFAHDHNSQFPMEVSTNNGGTLEFMRLATNLGGEIYFSFRHYQALGRELDTPKVLICPTDTRLAAENFSNLRNENLSYFVSGSALYDNPMSILSGDRNIDTYDLGLRSVLRLDANDLPGWTSEMHQRQGNLLFADAHVEQVNNNGLRAALQSAPGGRVVLLTPVQAPQVATAATGNGGSGQGTTAGAAANPKSEEAVALASKGATSETARATALVSRTAKSGRPRADGAIPSEGQVTDSSQPTSGAHGQPQASSRSSGSENAEAEYKPNTWPGFVGQYVTSTGAKVTWLLLLAILSVLIYFEIRRRRDKVAKRETSES